MRCFYESAQVLEAAENQPTSAAQVHKQLAKLNDTVFTLQSVEFEACGAFIPVKLLNQARREIVDRLYEEKLRSKPRRVAADEALVDAHGSEAAAARAGTRCSGRSCDEAGLSAGNADARLAEEMAPAPYLTASVTTPGAVRGLPEGRRARDLF